MCKEKKNRSIKSVNIVPTGESDASKNLSDPRGMQTAFDSISDSNSGKEKK